ncbi:MAG: serine hydrolase, partial [Prolixibacteraceae bacterium]|nr:serine hydrolase [Prolixibacteraceae bacterium]
MIKLRSYFLFLFIILFIVAFKFYPFEDHAKPQVENTVPIDIPELNPLLEIYKTIEQYDSILSSEIIESGTVGAAIVITYKNQIAFQKCYGVKKTGEKDSINKNTIFRLASVSKTITGILAGMLS